ncbi:MAG: hypothetical protein WD749_08640 [Phycisphaerales bacterium]
MRWPLPIAAALALAVAACEEKPKPTANAGQPPAAAASRPNAADLYRDAWSRISRELNLATGMFSFQDGVIRVEASENGPATWEEIADLLRRNQPVVNDLVAAAAADRCDWGFPPASSISRRADMGPMLEVHGKRRMMARVLRADAIRAWRDGDEPGAVARMSALYGLVCHSPGEPTVTWALVDVALLTLANETARGMADAPPHLSASHRKALLDQLNRLDPSDPAGLAKARKAEGPGDARLEQSLNEAHARLAADIAATKAALGE